MEREREKETEENGETRRRDEKEGGNKWGKEVRKESKKNDDEK